MTDLLKKLLDDGYKIADASKFAKFIEAAHVYVPKSIGLPLIGKKALILTKDEEVIIIKQD